MGAAANLGPTVTGSSTYSRLHTTFLATSRSQHQVSNDAIRFVLTCLASKICALFIGPWLRLSEIR